LVESRKSKVNGQKKLRALKLILALDPRPSTLDYFLALFCFALGLMSKPMLVSLPFVLLLLDYWPLDRWKHRSIRNLVVEKTPFLRWRRLPVS
jgi:4-amino-4-deoxy-L-arabinose transferase-like glycosyltransferase